jgi:hypothetical protein
MKNLAIVIPAFKSQFFEQALSSIVKQSNRNFNGYIFDDAGPEEIFEIASKYPQFKYFRFDENLGGKNLVSHWNRCLEKIAEEWVWFFSDDDIASDNCVEEFYEKSKEFPMSNVFRFELDIIDSIGNDNRGYRDLHNQTSLEFLGSKLEKTVSVVPDHIFNKKRLFELNKGFVDFPLAWCSDDATWMLLGKENGIVAINNARVKWRISGLNISSIKDRKTMKIKLHAFMLFYLWCSKNFSLSFSHKLKFLRSFVRLNETVPFLHFFQPLIYRSPVFILAILLVPIRRLYLILKRLARLFNRIGVDK